MIDRTSDLTWFFNTFVPAPQGGFALMNPPGHENKYVRKGEPLTVDHIRGAFNGETRRTRAGGDWRVIACSYGCIPQTPGKTPQAKNIAFDIDHGGEAAVAALLSICAQYGVWAFGQLSESPTHHGGHVWILGEDWQPASLLHDIGKRLALAANVEAEIYPTNADMRLPLMTHLRAPGGAHRFPLLFPGGEIVDAGDPWAALAKLHAQARFTTPNQLTELLDHLPSLPIGGGMQPRHRSKVTPSNLDSVIGWFNSNYPLHTLLEDAGAQFKHADQRLVCCPFHDDHSPSLAIWRHEGNDKMVCHCFSQGSNCPAARGAYLDAFDLFCLTHHLTPSDAVKRLVDEHGLGQKRAFVIEQTAPPPPTGPDALARHQRVIAQARGRLVNELVNAGTQRGQVTVIRATPGLGKTHAAAELANRLQGHGATVAIVAPTLAVAENEWLPRLKNGYVLRSKIDLCTCHDKAFLAACVKFGFSYPKCTDPNCPYATQAKTAFGKVTVFQHAHLALSEFSGVDVIIIDESPLNALLPEHNVTYGMLSGFVTRHPEDAAAPLCRALMAAAGDLPETLTDTRGEALIAAVEKHLDGWTLDDALTRARRSRFNVTQPTPPESVEKMSPQFLAGLIAALTDNRAAFSYGKSAQINGWAYSWHERRVAAQAAYDSLFRPAVVVLDGSANEEVSRRLYEPWPTRFVDIDCPLSPLVEVTQITCTHSTRRVAQEQRKLTDLAESVAVVCAQMGVQLDGGITYQAATDTLQRVLGGEWLHYGGQRGANDLAGANALAVVCSPTAPPAALERRALALWPDVDCTWHKAGAALYDAADPRLQAMNRLTAYEELRQSVYRARPVTATAPMHLLVFTPWDLAPIGLAPNHVITALPHGNSSEAKRAVEQYRAGFSHAENPELQPFGRFQLGIIYRPELPPPFENASRVAVQERNGSHSKTNMATPPLPAPIEQPAPVLAPPAPPYAPAVGDVLTKHGKKIMVNRLADGKVCFEVYDLGVREGEFSLPVDSFTAQVVGSRPKIERQGVPL